jgi:hypothetical protein
VGPREDGTPPSVQDFIIGKFGDDHVNAKFIRLYQACIEPFVVMRNAIEHPNSASWSSRISLAKETS